MAPMSAWRSYRAWDAGTAAAVARYGPDPNGWPDADVVQPLWDAMPLWLRVGLCLRCHWVDAVYEIHPPLGRWLVERRAARRAA